MDSPNSTVRQSLQEIATLLYYLYEHYIQVCESFAKCIFIYPFFKDGEFNKTNSFGGFVSFVGDLKLLSNRISLIEVETVFRKALGSARNAHSSMTYEDFYSCLRSVGCILYINTAENSRRALHCLLTEVIVMLSS